MLYADKITIRMSYNSVPVELTFDTAERGEPITPEDIKYVIDEALKNGLAAPVAFVKKPNNEGKKGIVKQVTYLADKKMYAVESVLDDKTDFVWNEFSKSAFRPGDRIKIIKNDRGFYAGQLIENEEEEEESEEKKS